MCGSWLVRGLPGLASAVDTSFSPPDLCFSSSPSSLSLIVQPAMMRSLSLFTLLALVTAGPSLTCAKHVRRGQNAPLNGVKTLDVDFTTYKGEGLSTFLDKHSLYVSNYPVDSTPISHTFVPSNVDIVDGALRLKVTGQSGEGDVKSAEVGTYASNIRYGTFTTIAKLTPVPGVCFGAFTYTDVRSRAFRVLRQL